MTSLPHGMQEARPGFAWEFHHLVQVFRYLVDFIFFVLYRIYFLFYHKGF